MQPKLLGYILPIPSWAGTPNEMLIYLPLLTLYAKHEKPAFSGI